MFDFAKKATLGLVLGATALTAMAVPADAQRYRGGYHGYHGGYHGGYHRGYRGDGALVAGIAGLAIGAAIASSDRRYDYDRPYYYDRGYYPDPYYRDYRRYYDDPYRCYTRFQWDPYLRERVPVRYCR